VRLPVRSQHCLWEGTPGDARQNKAEFEYWDCTRFSQAVQSHTHRHAGGRETGHAAACNHEERNMWAILFSLALSAAVCFGVADRLFQSYKIFDPPSVPGISPS